MKRTWQNTQAHRSRCADRFVFCAIKIHMYDEVDYMLTLKALLYLSALAWSQNDKWNNWHNILRKRE